MDCLLFVPFIPADSVSSFAGFRDCPDVPSRKQFGQSLLNRNGPLDRVPA